MVKIDKKIGNTIQFSSRWHVNITIRCTLQNIVCYSMEHFFELFCGNDLIGGLSDS